MCEQREREHQIVQVDENAFIPFTEAIEKRQQLIALKRKMSQELEILTKSVSSLSRAIENSCDHDWVNEVEYSAGEKDTSHYCKICWKCGPGRAYNR
tara:strand:- start:38 stop:328 length:291 start_codon:yes stop_codon:yes gene_type:complete